ncbi:adhesion G protein-coupled receptor E1 isoform X2 [Phacochoerus africanus]|uniref:adhesion G protein-coupled receptor E1 isoform X2 n=1 Tax=Phacochoerus africanus TaxID=41426 RepID=UPI001FDA6696|nr:adhesion G protein-coupled receptor E1 isoform X2 [Phacochoerus africanus]
MWHFSFLLFWGCCGFYSWVIFTLSPLESMAQSGNECTDTTMCPAYATCTNTSDSYYCSCKIGFLSTNGQMQFKDPTVECLDIDECSQSPPVCGPHSICKNLPGRYRCSCLTGFSSPTGNNWILGKKGRFICTDVNECANPKTCPEHAICRNSVGSYSCVCKPGFESSRGKMSVQGPGQMCRDIDECSQSPPACGPHSVCRNLPGSYKCSCLPGFSSPTGDDWIPAKGGGFACVDINECLQSGVCPEHSQCSNSLGSYSCSCHVGFTSTNSICEDVDECTKPRTCPEHATCRNSVGSYSCVCKPGFESSSGKMSVQGPGEMCRDIDECSQSPPACGPHSVCRNLPGSYKCSCLPGFSSPTGDDWIPAKGGGFACVDINECLQSGVCPEHSQCSNSLGSYSCSCHVGFTSTNSICEDVDECANPRACPEHASCRNSVGSYSCVCKPGFESSTGKMGIQGPGETCRDVDECSSNSTLCGPSSVCTNLPGKYSCSCLPGFFSPGVWSPEKPEAFKCTGVPFKCKEDVMLNNEWVQLCQDGAAVKPKYNTAERFASVIEKTFTRSSFTKEEISTLATVLLKSVESTTLASFLKPSANVSQTIQTEYLDIESKVINKGCTEENETFNLKAKGDKMKIWCSTIKESVSTGISGVAFVSFEHMESVLDERFFQDPQTPWANSKRKLKMNSRIVSGIITGEKKEGFSKPVIYTLENIQPKQNFESPICVSWNTDGKGGRWTPSGCVTLEASETHTVCSCNQMVNLAVIMASGELTMEFALFVISHVGTIFSLVCLAVAIITFLLCRTICNHNTYIHLHLCVCLFLANLLFLTGADKTHHQIGCAIIAGFLHYLFLACFFWMLVEAVMLFLMVRNLKVVNYFSSHNIKMLHLCAFGYGLPGLVVFVAANIHPQGYGMYNRCWLNTEKGFIWSFLGPVCTIIVVNSILLTWTLGILRQKLSSLNDEVSTLKDTRLLTFKAFAQIFILGCSWVLGIFQIGPIAGIMAYLFTVINSLQGAFIFLIHCLLNRQVREAYSRCITGKTKPGSQTSGISLSSVPSASKTG